MKSFARFFGIGVGEKEDPKENIIENSSENSANEISASESETAIALAAVETESVSVTSTRDVKQLNVHEIVTNPFQPRKTFNEEALQDLAASIKEFGVIQPLLVRQVDERYELVAGERRLRASKLAGLLEVPVIIKQLTDKEMAELAMIENLQREDLHFLEEAEGFHQLLINFGFTQEVLAKRMGKSQSTIANKLRLLKLSDEVRQVICGASLTERHARALLKLTDEAKQKEALQVIVERGLNVRESEVLIKEIEGEASTEKEKKPQKQNVIRVIRDVRIFMNTIHSVVKEMKKSGLNIKVDQEDDDEYITVKMVIPKRKN